MDNNTIPDMKKIVNNWHHISVYLAGFFALLAVLLPVDIVIRLLLLSSAILALHFYEEFGWPGGFPYMGVKVLLGKDELDPSKWNCNHLSSMFGNWTALVLIYLIPVFLPSVRFLTMSAMLFNFLELFMHLVLFNVRLKQLYNPGLITAVFGLAPISFYYFFCVFDSAAFVWYDYVLAVVYFVMVFWFCFRSPLYWNLGKKSGYEFNEQSAFGPMRR